VLKIVTAFTVAHSITLSVATRESSSCLPAGLSRRRGFRCFGGSQQRASILSWPRLDRGLLLRTNPRVRFANV
jgi:hypothetical protein